MSDKARDGVWQEVTELEAVRRKKVETFFATPVTDTDSADVAAAIREVLRLNQTVTELGIQARENLGNACRLQQVGNKARRAYSECTAVSSVLL
jgi:hypothetical protein